MTTIRYFIPEDGDEERHPNVFLAPKSRQPGAPPTLGQVKDAFPLSGRYHFRFKAPLYPGGDREKGAMAVWMDVVQDNALIPSWKNGIVTKVTRLSAEEEDEDDDEDFGHVHVSAPAPPPARAPPAHQSSTASTASSDHVDLFDGPSPSSAAPAAAAAPNLFDHTPPPSAPTSGGSLLDFGSQPAPVPVAAHSDFLGMTAPPPSGQPGYPPQQPPPMQQRPIPPPQQQPPQQQRNTINQYPQQQGGAFGGLNW